MLALLVFKTQRINKSAENYSPSLSYAFINIKDFDPINTYIERIKDV